VWIGLDRNRREVLSLGLSKTVVGDALNLPFKSGSIDSIVLAEVLEHLYDISSIIREVNRVLAVEGCLFLTTPNPYALSLWPKFWLLARNPAERSTYRRFLGAPDHCIFWEPLSLVNLLYDHGLVVEEITTKNLDIPVLRRFWSAARLLDVDSWPWNRVGSYTCLSARRIK
jgi:SAM-dependent methyltransferase